MVNLSCILLIVFSWLSNFIYGQRIEQYNEKLAGTNQVIFVTTPDWSSPSGTCMLYERKNGHSEWHCMRSFDVMVGRNGLAWDNNNIIKKFTSQKIKHEGDGNAPAGLFRLGNVFSYHTLEKLHMPFTQVDSNDICVDDVGSPFYNMLVHGDDSLKNSVKSYENMRRKDELYEYGVWVNYNTDMIIPGNGSCIFLHIWKTSSTPTSGCTSMSRENMVWLIEWLREKDNPMLLQLSAQ